MSQVRAKGYTAGPPSTLATSEPTIPLGQAVPSRNASESEQLFVGGSYNGHKTRVLLTCQWDDCTEATGC